MSSSSTNNSFVFGAGANGEFEFSAGFGNPFSASATAPAPAAPPPADRESLPATPSGGYVTLAQYELIEKRYEELRVAVRAHIDEVMGLIKGVILGQGGDGHLGEDDDED